MRHIKYSTPFLALLLCYPTVAQHVKINPPDDATNRIEAAAVKSPLQSTPLFKSIEPKAGSVKWAITLKNRTGYDFSLPEVAAIKEAKRNLKLSTYDPVEAEEYESRAVTPVIGNSFEGNWTVDSTPPDNTIAISNEGIIVSANNDGIEYYNESGAHLYFDMWTDFFDNSNLTSSFFEPRVLYDSEEDRFVLVVLHGSTPATSRVILSFSKTGNPVNGWNTYILPGNPLGDNNWINYPTLGVSNNEVYVSGNLFSGTSFSQAVVYQINKMDGYAGSALDWQFWSDFFNNPFAITPASFGQEGNYGPGIFFISTLAAGEDHYWFWDLTNDIGNNEEFIGYIVPSDAYSPAANALQPEIPDELDNGDCRVQNAFYLDGNIHFVFHTDIGSGWSGISYNRFSVSNQSVLTATLGEAGTSDYSYPAAASFATSTSDRSVMIGFLRSSPAIFPECRVVNCDQGMAWSTATLVKAGETFVDFLTADEKWGAYTGIARRHGTNDPIVWMAGSYGANIAQPPVDNTYKTRIAQVTNGMVSTVDAGRSIESAVFPNPTYDLMQVSFTVAVSEQITIAIHDMHGHLVKILYRDTPLTGEHYLSFNKGALAPGTYILSIASPTQVLAQEKIIMVE